jgi:hypothetical protein
MKSILLCALVAIVPAIAFGQGQVKLSQETEQTWVGFDNPRIVNGNVVTGPKSKPTLASSETKIVVAGADEYKWRDIECERIPSLEYIELSEVPGGYTFPKDTTAGQYRIALRLYDPTLQPVSKRLTIDLKPLDPFTPVVPDINSGLAADARKVMVALVQSMAKDMTVIADGIKAGSIRTTDDVKNLNVKQDEAGRNAFKAAMKALMEPKLGTAVGPLVPEAEPVFRNIAIGFGSVK